MTNITLELTQAQNLALDLVAIDKQTWVDNLVINRARIALEEVISDKLIWNQAIASASHNGIDTADDWAVLLHARDAKLIKTAAEKEAARQLEIQQEIKSLTAPTDPLSLTLNQVQFFTLLEVNFEKTRDEIVAVIESMIVDPMEKSAAKNKFLYSQEYHRDNELFSILSPELSISDAQIDEAWLEALQI